MLLLNMEQGSLEWKAFRKTKITATDIPKIMGVSPWDTPRTLYLKKMGLMEEKKVSSAMLEGAAYESIIREMCEKHLNMIFTPAIGLNSDHTWAMASFDGINETDLCLLEIKFANKTDHEKALSGVVPEKYYPQVQWQLFVSGYEFGYYASYHKASDDLTILKVEANPSAISIYVNEAYKFHLLEDAPEEGPDDSYHHDKDFQWIMLSDDLKKAQKDAKLADENLKIAKDRFVKYIEEKNLSHIHSHKGCEVEISYVTRKGSIKYDSIPEVKEILDSIDLESYRGKETGYWKFCVKEDL